MGWNSSFRGRDIRRSATWHPRYLYDCLRSLLVPTVTHLPDYRTRPSRVCEIADAARLIAQGLSNHEIADRIMVSEPTVRAHVSRILGKLHLAGRTQAALYAMREGLTDAASAPEA